MMKITIVATAAVAGAFLALSGAGVAHAGTTTGDGEILSGNQVSAPIAIPADDCDNAIALLGVADVGCADAEWMAGASWDGGYLSGAARIAGVSWDGGGGITSSAARIAGVSWDGGFASYAEDIHEQIAVSVAVPAGGCGKSASHHTSLCHGVVEREHRVIALSAASPCPCEPLACLCEPLICPCGVSHGHHISPHKPLRHPVRHAAHIVTPVASKAHGAPTPIIRMLPVTGANLAGITGSGVGLLGTGAGALFGAARVTDRRRRRGAA